MNRVLIFLLVILSQPARSQEGPYLTLDRFSMQLTKFSCNRELQTPDIRCADYKGRVAVNFDLELFRYGFWRNYVHGEGTNAAFTTVGWQYEFGFKIGSQFEFFHKHHSRHVLDREQPKIWDENLNMPVDGRFPVEDSYGIRIIFYEKKKR